MVAVGNAAWCTAARVSARKRVSSISATKGAHGGGIGVAGDFGGDEHGAVVVACVAECGSQFLLGSDFHRRKTKPISHRGPVHVAIERAFRGVVALDLFDANQIEHVVIE